jgi:hypothetical protein
MISHNPQLAMLAGAEAPNSHADGTIGRRNGLLRVLAPLYGATDSASVIVVHTDAARLR